MNASPKPIHPELRSFRPCASAQLCYKEGMTTKTATLGIPASAATKYETAIKGLFGKMDQLRKQMRRDQVDITKSQKRTRVKLAELDEMMR